MVNLLFVNNGVQVNSTPSPPFDVCIRSTQVLPSGESGTNYVSLLFVEVGQPWLTEWYWEELIKAHLKQAIYNMIMTFRYEAVFRKLIVWKEPDLGSLLLALLNIKILHTKCGFDYVTLNFIHILDIRF
jgi:protoporphyrinogen oxidase